MHLCRLNQAGKISLTGVVSKATSLSPVLDYHSEASPTGVAILFFRIQNMHSADMSVEVVGDIPQLGQCSVAVFLVLHLSESQEALWKLETQWWLPGRSVSRFTTQQYIKLCF